MVYVIVKLVTENYKILQYFAPHLLNSDTIHGNFGHPNLQSETITKMWRYGRN